jgi:2-amino-4-hydroxy-6-hydroxymethyldihydropteridine diphosphokinase
MKVVIALGANLGDPRKQVCMAIDAMRDVMRVDKVSSLYETEPFGVPDEQPPYINAVLIGECELSPADLMKEILAIEAEMGRVRTFTNAARMIDIDVIDYGAQLLDDDFVRLPHPRAHERRFVLEPWAEIEPDGELPGRGAITQLLAGLS